jgi:septum formation protein
VRWSQIAATSIDRYHAPHGLNNMKATRIILGSASPRRRHLLAELGMPFEVVEPNVDETPWANEEPASHALRIAAEKARAVLSREADNGPATIVAADTIVVVERQILGKPADASEARAMLQMVSGRWHEVITGLCVLKQGSSAVEEIGRAERTRVRMRPIAAAEVDAYIATGEPMDKAGAYAIQGGASAFVENIEGSYSNVVGLPMEVLRKILGHP